MVFKTNGYSLFGNSLTLTGPATLQADTDVYATVSPILSGSSGITKSGDGTVFINNINNVFTGGVTVNAGTLAFSVTRKRNNNEVTTKYSGKRDGDTIKGKIEGPQGQPRDWEAKRAKE